MRKTLLYCLLFTCSVAAADPYRESHVKGATLEDYMGFHSRTPPYGRYYYGPDERGDNFFDLYVPKKVDSQKVAVVVIHGGCWDSKFEGFPQAGQVVDYFLEKGHVVFNVEYSRADAGGGYPKTYDDISNALLKINSTVDEERLTATGLALIGHSAGGHLAVWAASGGDEVHTKKYLEKVKIRKVIALGGILNLSEAEKACPNISNFGGATKISGVNPKVTSPIMMESNVNIFLINGSLDTVAPPDYAIEYFKSRNAGLVNYRIIPGVTHYDLMSSSSGVLDVVLDVISSN